MVSLRLKACATSEGGGVILTEFLHDWGRRAVLLFFNYTMEFALKLRKNTENLIQGSRLE
jgi:hypothetical protein